MGCFYIVYLILLIIELKTNISDIMPSSHLGYGVLTLFFVSWHKTKAINKKNIDIWYIDFVLNFIIF